MFRFRLSVERFLRSAVLGTVALCSPHKRDLSCTSTYRHCRPHPFIVAIVGSLWLPSESLRSSSSSQWSFSRLELSSSPLSMSPRHRCLRLALASSSSSPLSRTPRRRCRRLLVVLARAPPRCIAVVMGIRGSYQPPGGGGGGSGRDI
jgi:hypothetical protein